MMEKSVLGGNLKTYASKKCRVSNYRMSYVDFKKEEAFDKLFEDEVNKKPFTSKKTDIEGGITRSTKSFIPSTFKAPVLKNIQNYSCVSRKPSLLQQTKKKKVRTKISQRNKENSLKCCSRLYKSNSDSDSDLKGLSIYELDVNINPLADYKKRIASKRTKPKQRSRHPSIISNINTNSCLSENEMILPSRVLISNSNFSDSSVDKPNRIPANPSGEVFKKPTLFIERSSDLFYKNSINKNRGLKKTRKKLSFLSPNCSRDSEHDVDNSFENADGFFLANRSNVDELFNSDNEDEGENCYSVVFNPGTASTPQFTRKVSPSSRGYGTNKNDENIETEPIQDTSPALRSPNHHEQSNTFKDESPRCSLVTEYEASNQNIQVTLHDSSEISKHELFNMSTQVVVNESSHFFKNESCNLSDPLTVSKHNYEIEKSAEHLNCSLDSFVVFTSSDNDSLSMDLNRNTNVESSKVETILKNNRSETVPKNNILVKSRDTDSNYSLHIFLNKTSFHTCIKKQQDSDNSILFSSENNSLLKYANEEFTNEHELPSNMWGLINDVEELDLSNVEAKQKTSADESPHITKEEPDIEENSLLEEKMSCSSKELSDEFSMMTITHKLEIQNHSLNRIIELLSPIPASTDSEVERDSSSEIINFPHPNQAQAKSTFEHENFEGWSSEQYAKALEKSKTIERICEELEAKNVPPEEEIPSHLKLVTRRRKKTFIMPTLNEENSDLEENQINLYDNAKNSPVLSQESPQLGSYNRTSVCTSRFLERSSVLGHSLVLAAGKKWRRSFITLKNIREYGFQSQTEHVDLKGRCWRKNVEELISNQLDENSELKEIAENSTKTFSNETFLNPNYTCLEKCKWPSKARFSLCVNQKSPSRQQTEENSEITSSSDTSKLQGDKSYFSFVGSQQNSRIENNCDLEAGDCSQSHKVSFEGYDVRDHLSAKETVLRYCKQSEPLPFEECFNDRLLQKNCKKIGEGVYGEVFMLKRNRAHCSVLKIIPIEGDLLINGEKQKKYEEIVSELIISIELSDLRKKKDYYTDNFAELQKCWCVYGKYPDRLINLWDAYNNEKGSDNDSPKVFEDNQLFIILELSHGGEDVESFEFNNAQQTLSVFTQVAYALAVAEQAFNFEHRDLHWGNILVSKSKTEKTKYIIGDLEHTVRLRGVKVTIIDYTLSRISINNCIVFNDIGQDPELFTAQGDYQFEVYRLMKNEVSDIWNQFMPKTNVYWLHYLLDKMLKEVRYRRISTQIHQVNFIRLREFFEFILGFASCYDLISDSYFKRTISTAK